MKVEVRPMEERDRERMVAIHAQAFQVPEYRLVRQRTLPLDRGWVITANGRVAGALRIDRVGQYFGGRSVGCAFVSAVKIAAEARGRGLARTFVAEVMRALAADGVPLSALYPSSPPLYRAVGYETAGLHVRYRLPSAQLPSRLLEPLEPWEERHDGAVHDAYRSFAMARAGLIDRDARWWSEWILDPYIERPTYRYLLADGDRVRGYLVYGQAPDPRSDMPYVAALSCTDLVWLDAGAARALFAFLGAQGPLVSSATWPGSPVDPTVAFQSAPVSATTVFHWMLRLVRVRDALEGRGYADGASGRVTLRIHDEALPANAGEITIEIADGQARVEPGGRAEAELDARALAPLFTGWLDATELARLELLRGASADLVRRLDDWFRGPVPWMAEVV